MECLIPVSRRSFSKLVSDDISEDMPGQKTFISVSCSSKSERQYLVII